MATFSLILLLLPLLFLSTLTAATPIEDICRQTKNPTRCKNLLITFDPRSTDAPLPLLEELAIDEATGNSRQVKNRAHDLFSSAKDPMLKKMYANCETLFGGAADALVGARQSLKQRAYAKIVAAAGTVGAAVGGCTSPELKKEAEDVGVIGEAIRLIAQKL